MPSYIVDLKYDNGHKLSYLIENVESVYAARKKVREDCIGYDPGVPVEITELPITSGKVFKFECLGGMD